MNAADGKENAVMPLRLRNCEVRPYLASDAPSIAGFANNRKIWLNLRDGFPHPYRLSDAEAFIKRVTGADPETNFAIAVEGQAVGGIGYLRHTDVERVSAEIGYWLGEPFWGRGIVTEALAAVTAYAIAKHGLTRVYAVPYEWNEASFRVLEKVGYRLEARMRKSAIKDGKVIDQMLYAFVVE